MWGIVWLWVLQIQRRIPCNNTNSICIYSVSMCDIFNSIPCSLISNISPYIVGILEFPVRKRDFNSPCSQNMSPPPGNKDVGTDSAVSCKIIVFSCDQAALQMVFSVCPSVRLSVCHTFFTMFPSSDHHESYYHGQKWCPCKRSRSEVKGQGHRGQHPT